MLNRALIVVLAILNLGVAVWWMTPRAAQAPVPEMAETGVAGLELVAPESLAKATMPPRSSGAAASADAPQQAVADEHCLRLGPFAEQAQGQAALAALGNGVVRSRLRETSSKATANYRIMLPPAASREEAQATARRIAEAGFADYYVLDQGEDANAIVLGQYRNREGAQRRQAELVAAGFPAQLHDSGGEESTRWWLDVAVANAAAATTLQRRSGAQQQQALDCTQLR